MPMDIGFVCSDEEFVTNLTLAEVARRLSSKGLVLAGTIQPVEADRPAGKCDIVIGLLPDGERRSISLNLGPGATACRLDAGALEEAVQVVLTRMPSAQALIVNKFGKQEATGRGLVPAIGEAVSLGLPVLVGVLPAWRDPFLTFCGGAARELSPDADAITAWLLERGAKPLPTELEHP